MGVRAAGHVTTAVTRRRPIATGSGAVGTNAGSGGPSVWVLAGLFTLFLGLPIVTLIARAFLDGSLIAVAGTSAVLAALALSLDDNGHQPGPHGRDRCAVGHRPGTPDLPWQVARRGDRRPAVVLPPAVAGLALLLVFGRRGLLAAPLQAAGIDIAFTTIAVILAQTFVSAPFFVRVGACRDRRRRT